MIQSWLNQNHLAYQWLIDQKVFSLAGDNYCIIKEKEGLILDETFDLILDEEEGELISQHECKYLVFQLGEWIFYTPPNKIKLTPLKYIGASTQATDYPHLGIHGMYEICNGSRNYKDWCKKAKFLGVTVLGICEYNTLAGTLQFQLDCKDAGIKSILGMTALVKNETNHTYRVKLYAKNEIGWRNLLYVNKAINVDNEGFIRQKELEKLSQGLIFVFEECNQHTLSSPHPSLEYYFQVDSVQWKSDERDLRHLENIKKIAGLDQPAALVCDSYYLDQQDHGVKVLLNKISKNNLDNQSEDQYFKSKQDADSLVDLFEDKKRGQEFVRKAFDNLSQVVERCNFEIETGKFYLPEYKLTDVELILHENKDQLFWDLIDQGLYKKIINKGIDPSPYLERIEMEYDIISRGGFVDYFLILSDVMRWCKMKNMLTGIGRGSAAGSLIAYLLDLTKVDSLKYDLLFSRFLNESRFGRGLPDIDSDVLSRGRDAVKRYIEERYGINNVCSIGTYGTFKTKAVVRDLCRVHGVAPQEMNYFASMMEESDGNYESIFRQALQTKIFKQFIDDNYQTINAVPLILGQPKTNSVHAAGVIITPDSKNGEGMTIYNWMPVKKMDGIVISEWEGPQLEMAGFLKEDILGIKQLDKFQDIFELIEKNGKTTPDLDNIDTEDKNVYELFCQGYNQDLFHFGSIGLTSYSQQVKPRNIEELIAMIALYRPGAMEFGAHEDYVKIKMGRKQPEYDHIIVKQITEPTFGLMIYQEQSSKICIDLAGFTGVEADDVRKNISKKHMDKLKTFRQKFIEGAMKNDCSEDVATRIWNKIEAFGSYSFNRSHSCAYALTGYFCQWLKYHFPIEFWTVSLQYADEDEIPGRINEISRLQNIKILSPNINKSSTAFTSDIEKNSIYWSIGKIRNVGEVALNVIINERNTNGAFFSLEEFVSRIDRRKVNKTCIVNLILSGCFDELENIKFITQRRKLLIWFFTLIKQPMPEQYMSNANNEWFWFLEQKRVSSSGLFDYTQLFGSFRTIDLEHYYCTPDKILLEENVGCNAALVGILLEVIPKKSKKGAFAQIVIEQNNALAEVTLWNESWEKYRSALDQSLGRIVAVDGTIVADKWRKHNVIHSQINTKVEII